jgi:ribonuclease D
LQILNTSSFPSKLCDSTDSKDKSTTEASSLQNRIQKCLLSIINHLEPGKGDSIVSSLLRGDSEEAFEFLDRCRETAETYLDEAQGQHSSQQVAFIQNQLLQVQKRQYQTNKYGSARRYPTTKLMEKPQLGFTDVIDNSRDSPVRLKLVEKYHAFSSSIDRFTKNVGDENIEKTHPYYKEISSLGYQTWQLDSKGVIPFTSLEESEPVTWVDSEASLFEMIDDFEGKNQSSSSLYRHARDSVTGCCKIKELAIDLEAHSIRSFQGFTCLIQISSRDRDYIIDALSLRGNLHALNRVTTDPTIVKVLHGSDSDIAWLQRDFGVYIVNLFDTGQASRILMYPSYSLAYLLSKFPNVTANKEFQTADWRERPLPAVMLAYAREDTHYLLGIYDRMKQELIEKSSSLVPGTTLRVQTRKDGVHYVLDSCQIPNLLKDVLDKSAEKSLIVYDKERFSQSAYKRVMMKLGLKDINDEDSVNNRVFSAVYDWRDATAREEDESPHFVMPNKLIQRISENVPTNMDALVRSCNPMPPLVLTKSAELLKVIKNVVESKPSSSSSSVTAHEPSPILMSAHESTLSFSSSLLHYPLMPSTKLSDISVRRKIVFQPSKKSKIITVFEDSRQSYLENPNNRARMYLDVMSNYPINELFEFKVLPKNLELEKSVNQGKTVSNPETETSDERSVSEVPEQFNSIEQRFGSFDPKSNRKVKKRSREVAGIEKLATGKVDYEKLSNLTKHAQVVDLLHPSPKQSVVKNSSKKRGKRNPFLK